MGSGDRGGGHWLGWRKEGGMWLEQGVKIGGGGDARERARGPSGLQIGVHCNMVRKLAPLGWRMAISVAGQLWCRECAGL